MLRMTEGQADLHDQSTPQSTFRVVDYEFLPTRLNNDEKFRAAAQKLSGDENLPLTFPRVLNYKYAVGYGPQYLERLTSMPANLLDSDTFEADPELRGPMEEIILFTNSQRKENGFPLFEVKGEGWSVYFIQRLNEIKKVHDEYSSPEDLETIDGPELKSLYFPDKTPERTSELKERPADASVRSTKKKLDSYPPADGPGKIPDVSLSFHKNSRGENVVRGKVRRHKGMS